MVVDAKHTIELGTVGVPFGIDEGDKAKKLGKLSFGVSADFAAAAAALASKYGVTAPITISVAEFADAGVETLTALASVSLCALLDNHFKFRVRLHSSMPGSGFVDSIDIDLPAKYQGCSKSDQSQVTVADILGAAPDAAGTAFLAYLPARRGEEPQNLPTQGAPHMGQRRIAATAEGGADVDPATGSPKPVAPEPTFWSKYGTYIMIGGAVFLFAGGGGAEGGEGQRRGGGTAARG